MAVRWVKKSGPREYHSRDSVDISIGWGYTLERDGALHEIRVEDVGSVGTLPDECVRALRSRGWSAVAPHLSDETPPTRIVSTTAGLVREYS